MQLRKSGMLALAIVAILAAAAPARAQITTGNITGTVNDSQGGVIPGATVVLKSETRPLLEVDALVSLGPGNECAAVTAVQEQHD